MNSTLDSIKARSELASLIPTNGRAVVVGAGADAFVVGLLNNRPGFHLVLVDPWEPVGMETREQVDERYNRTLTCLTSAHPKRCTVMRKQCRDALGFLPGACLDFVYLQDNEHADYERFMRTWWNKVKPGGVFAGRGASTATVEVVRFFKALGLRYGTTSYDTEPSWWVRK